MNRLQTALSLLTSATAYKKPLPARSTQIRTENLGRGIFRRPQASQTAQRRHRAEFAELPTYKDGGQSSDTVKRKVTWDPGRDGDRYLSRKPSPRTETYNP